MKNNYYKIEYKLNKMKLNQYVKVQMINKNKLKSQMLY